jgi:hypothetical protein
MSFAQFGVVMMLFVIGLELQPSVLWRLRTSIVGLWRAAGAGDRRRGRPASRTGWGSPGRRRWPSG